MLAVVVVGCCLAVSAVSGDETSKFLSDELQKKAMSNGEAANEGFRRSLSCVKAWLEYADPVSGLIPVNLDW